MKIIFKNLADDVNALVSVGGGEEISVSQLSDYELELDEKTISFSVYYKRNFDIDLSVRETDKIMKAQLARCADFESGNLIKKAKSLVPLLVPLFISAFRRANDLAMAMEARCYRGGEHRTKMKPLRYQKRDYIAYGIVACYLVVGIAAGRLIPALLNFA